MSTPNFADFAQQMSTVPVPGFAIGANQFTTAIPFSMLQRLTVEPITLKTTKGAADPHMDSLRTLNGYVQREFAGAKAKNVEAYEKYILDHIAHGRGYFPRILLWSPRPLTVEESGYVLRIPLTQPEWLILDGQTGTQAYWQAARKNSALLNRLVRVEIYHGISKEDAAQIFHDSNCLGTNVSAAASISRDTRDPITHLAKELATKVPSLVGRVDYSGRQLTKKSSNIVTITSLRNMLTCIAEGGSGVARGNKPVTDMEDAELQTLYGFTMETVPAFFAKYAAQIGDREHYVLGLPGVLAAVGMVYHDAMTNETDPLEAIEKVDFRLGMNWSGIAVNISPEGKVTAAGGVKGSTNNVYKALAIEGDALYNRIRQPFVPVPAPPAKEKDAAKK